MHIHYPLLAFGTVTVGQLRKRRLKEVPLPHQVLAGGTFSARRPPYRGMAASLVAASHIAARGERKGARDCTLKGQSLHDFGERSNVTRYPRYQDTLLIYVCPPPLIHIGRFYHNIIK